MLWRLTDKYNDMVKMYDLGSEIITKVWKYIFNKNEIQPSANIFIFDRY